MCIECFIYLTVLLYIVYIILYNNEKKNLRISTKKKKNVSTRLL